VTGGKIGPKGEGEMGTVLVQYAVDHSIRIWYRLRMYPKLGEEKFPTTLIMTTGLDAGDGIVYQNGMLLTVCNVSRFPTS